MIALVFTLRPLSRTLWAETRGHTGARTVVVNDRSQPRLTRRWPINGGLMIGAAPDQHERTAGENLQEAVQEKLRPGRGRRQRLDVRVDLRVRMRLDLVVWASRHAPEPMFRTTAERVLVLWLGPPPAKAARHCLPRAPQVPRPTGAQLCGL
jgi:hypothetical protein